MLDVVSIVFVDSFGVQQQLMQVVDILFDDVSDIFKLSKLMPVVFSEHTLRAHYRMANLAEVLNFLVLMLEAKDFASYLVGDSPTRSVV